MIKGMTEKEKGMKQNSDVVEPFYEQIRLALNHFSDPQWLGENSPLAAPYFLGTVRQNDAEMDTSSGRGQVLQQALLLAAASLWPETLPKDEAGLLAAVQEERQEEGNKGSRYHYLLLELRYFRQHFKPTAVPYADNEYDIRDFLGVGRGPYFNHLKAARMRLGEALLHQVRPTFRLEQPVSLPETLVAREETAITTCLTVLENGQSVSISGVGGIGKTSYGSLLASHWPTQRVFWFTIRPHFTDQLDSLLFSLGYFLYRQGASGLWLQLVADGGKVDHLDLALAHIRGDLQTLRASPLLLCFDEVEHLYPAEPQQVSLLQVQLREFLGGLHTLAPLLFMGQHHGLRADYHVELTGFTVPQTAVLCRQSGIAYTSADIHHLQQYTAGNPRLMQLCLASSDQQKPLTETLAELPHAPSLQALFERVWQQLNAGQRQLLLQLAVFRSPAPGDVWRTEYANLQLLLKQHIVQKDNQGGLSLLPVFRDLIYQDQHRLSADMRERCHLAAAAIRAARGEYTAAAYHYVQAGEYIYAVQVWFPQRRQEARRGQAHTALAIFQQIPSRRLPEAEAQALSLLRSELYQLMGEPESGLQELNAVSWSPDQEITGHTHMLRGTFLNALGYPQAALENYNEGISLITRLLGQLVRFRYQRSTVYMQQRHMSESWREARLAQYEAEQLQGLVQEEQGHFDEAYLNYQRALALARSIGYDAGVAQTNRELAAVLGRQARVSEAVKHAEEAIAYYEQIGDRLNQEKARNALLVTYFQGGEFAKAIEIATHSLPFFEEAGMPFWTAVTASTLAEACFEVGELDKAYDYAQMVLKLEEPQSHPYALYTLGLVQRARHQLAEVRHYFSRAQEIAQENGDKYLEAYAWRALGESETDLPQEQKVRALVQALRLFEELGMVQEIEATRRLQT